MKIFVVSKASHWSGEELLCSAHAFKTAEEAAEFITSDYMADRGDLCYEMDEDEAWPKLKVTADQITGCAQFASPEFDCEHETLWRVDIQEL